MSHRILLLIVLLLGLSLGLVACGGTEEPGPTAEVAAPTAAPAEPTTAPAEPVDEPPAAFEPLAVSADCASGSVINEIAAVDELTVRFSLCRPEPAFLPKVAFVAFAIQPREHIESLGGTPELLENPIGTGPYQLAEWTRGSSMTYTAFPDYWGEEPKAETLVFRWSAEAAARLLDLQAGTVDGIDNPAPDDFETVLNNPDLQLIYKEPLNIFYVGMNNTYEPFDDINVRRAIAMGIDRQRLVDTFYPPGSTVAQYFTPCGLANGCVGDPWYEFDLEAARQLLADAGYPDGFQTQLSYRDVVRSYLPEVSQVATEIQAQLLENLNIDAEIVVLESGAFVAALGAGEIDGLHMYGWIADYAHITNFLDTHFGETSVRFGTLPEAIYGSIAAGAQEADPAAAEPFYVQANNAIREEVPMVPIAHAVAAAAYQADVTGATASPLSVDNFALADPGGRDILVWMQNAEPISLYCADETDSESLRACSQALESLYAYTPGGTEPVPALAESCEPNADLTEWICTLRAGVLFHDGSTLDANDVVATWAAGWDAASPYHVGNTGTFEYFTTLFGLINLPAE